MLPVMSSGHQVRSDSAFSLSNSTVSQEIVTVHDCQLIQKELNGAFTPSLLWTFALERQENISELDSKQVIRYNHGAEVD